MATSKTTNRGVTRRAPGRARRRVRRWLWGLGVLAGAGAVAGYLAWSYGWGGVPSVGDRAPAFTLEDGDGQPVNLGEYLGHKPVVLLFYMTHG